MKGLCLFLVRNHGSVKKKRQGRRSGFGTLTRVNRFVNIFFVKETLNIFFVNFVREMVNYIFAHLTIIPTCPSCHLTILTSHHHTILFILPSYNLIPSYNHAYLAITTRRTHHFLGIFVGELLIKPLRRCPGFHTILYYQQKPKINNSNSLAFCIL